MTRARNGTGIHPVIFIARRIPASSRRGKGFPISGHRDFEFDVLERFSAISMETWVFECPGMFAELNVVGVLELVGEGDISKHTGI